LSLKRWGRKGVNVEKKKKREKKPKKDVHERKRGFGKQGGNHCRGINKALNLLERCTCEERQIKRGKPNRRNRKNRQLLFPLEKKNRPDSGKKSKRWTHLYARKPAGTNQGRRITKKANENFTF